MINKKILLILLFIALKTYSQPFVDLFNIRYTKSIQNKNNSETTANHIYIGPDFPLKQKNNSLFVFSPVYENWSFNTEINKNILPTVSGLALALSIVVPLDENKWALTVSGIPRISSEGLTLNNGFQMGGILLTSYKRKENLTYKFGVYANTEFNGFIILPLLGIDWRIDKKNTLFGVLPNRMTFEHRINKSFYTGGNFRILSNSYRLKSGDYLRVDDRQLSAYLDYYPAKHLVISFEPGYGLLRKLGTGSVQSQNYVPNYNWGDGMFIKLTASYRIRL